MRLPAITSKRLIKALERAGFAVFRITGSHFFLKDTQNRIVCIPQHNKDMRRYFVKDILKKINMTEDELRKYL